MPVLEPPPRYHSFVCAAAKGVGRTGSRCIGLRRGLRAAWRLCAQEGPEAPERLRPRVSRAPGEADHPARDQRGPHLIQRHRLHRTNGSEAIEIGAIADGQQRQQREALTRADHVTQHLEAARGAAVVPRLGSADGERLIPQTVPLLEQQEVIGPQIGR